MNRLRLPFVHEENRHVTLVRQKEILKVNNSWMIFGRRPGKSSSTPTGVTVSLRCDETREIGVGSCKVFRASSFLLCSSEWTGRSNFILTNQSNWPHRTDRTRDINWYSRGGRSHIQWVWKLRGPIGRSGRPDYALLTCGKLSWAPQVSWTFFHKSFNTSTR